MRPTLPLLLACLLLTGCSVGRFFIYNFADTNDHTKFPSRPLSASTTPYPYAVAEPSRGPITIQRGGNERPLDEFLEDHKTVAFLIIRRDTILYERYFKGYDPARIHPSFSMAKSVIGMLIGRAIADGYIRDVQQPVTDFVPEMAAQGWDRVTLEHVLQMTSGMAFNESYVNPFGTAAKFYYGKRLEKNTIKLGLERAPGTEFHYMSGNSQLLGLILQRALRAKGDQRTVTAYLHDKLWQPLGMEFDGSWSIDRRKDGIEKTFCCLNAPARDFAKLGSLMLHKGEWHGRQLVPADWVERSTRVDTGRGGASYYQYQFWLPSQEGDYMMQGILGQFVYVDPTRELVIAWAGTTAT
jgi:CubicO group peptidase (beta-lactamase class C family)